MTSILEILLYREEVDLACYLTAFYDFNMEKKQKTEHAKMIILAIKYNQYKWLNYVWAFKKNYYNSDKKKNINLTELFGIIISVCEDRDSRIILKQEDEIKKCCDWMLDFSDQI